MDTSLATVLSLVDQLSEQEREQVTEYLIKKRYKDAAAVSNAQPDQAEVEQWIEKVKTLEYEQPIERSGLKNLADSEAEKLAAKRSWLELEGIAAGAGKEENAQAWVMQTRDEWNDRESRC